MTDNNQSHSQDFIWLDVRTLEEFSEGHVKHAKHIPYDELESRHQELQVSKDTHIKLYCRSGKRSDVGTRIMQQLGYENAVNEGGFSDLVARGEQAAQ